MVPGRYRSFLCRCSLRGLSKNAVQCQDAQSHTSSRNIWPSSDRTAIMSCRSTRANTPTVSHPTHPQSIHTVERCEECAQKDPSSPSDCPAHCRLYRAILSKESVEPSLLHPRLKPRLPLSESCSIRVLCSLHVPLRHLRPWWRHGRPTPMPIVLLHLLA